MRWVWAGTGLFFSAMLFASGVRLTAPVDADSRAVVSTDFHLDLLVTPHAGDAGSRIARRLTGDGDNWERIAELNPGSTNLSTEKPLRIPFDLLKPELQQSVLRKLFPDDALTDRGWRHRVATEGGGEGESLWAIAEWFTGDGTNYAAIRAANQGLGLATKKGESVMIPSTLLRPSLRAAAKAQRAINASGPSRQREQTAPDEVRTVDVKRDQPRRSSDAKAHVHESGETVSSPDVALTFEERDGKKFAVYRLQRGEALYSAVAVRFTGRVYAKDVNEAVDAIVAASGVADVARIAVNSPIRIPLELLTPEYRPSGDRRRIAYEKSKRESARAAKRVEVKNLRGVLIVLDAGHGGRDVGTMHDDLWESTYVYDVVCRLRAIIEKKSGARVEVTTRSRDGGYDPSRGDVPLNRTDHIVQTTPAYALEDAAVGVNLRWYLANSWYRKALSESVAPEKVVFLSIHADSLHPSLRGAMAYIPGQQYSVGSFTKKGEVYQTRAEVREHPVVSQSEEEALRAEGLSRELAQSIIDSIDDADLPVHEFNPVRENVVRDGREWVPAVIRYNKIPTRLLLEICNLGSEDDRELLRTRKYRQDLATSIYRGIDAFFSERDRPDPGESVVAGR